MKLAPWRRNMIAMAHGIILKPSGKMNWTANCVLYGAHPQESEVMSMFPIEADREIDAARSAALSIAKARFGAAGEVAYLHVHGKPGLYRACIGLYEGHGVTRGKSLSVLVAEYRGAQ